MHLEQADRSSLMSNSLQNLGTQNKLLILAIHNMIFFVNQDSLSRTQAKQTRGGAWHLKQLLWIPDVAVLETMSQKKIPFSFKLQLSGLSQEKSLIRHRHRGWKSLTTCPAGGRGRRGHTPNTPRTQWRPSPSPAWHRSPETSWAAGRRGKPWWGSTALHSPDPDSCKAKWAFHCEHRGCYETVPLETYVVYVCLGRQRAEVPPRAFAINYWKLLRWWGWGVGPVTKSSCCSVKGREFNSQNPHQAAQKPL